ncbi:LLM class flavin-dependent oxidoreductase [Streptantibioticus silvisoli]|uniref:LLM class flavin-dependent oxidoreductase n=1 Tax=Streptantibioticus silvisoli TaxID=2705255 RepID=A0ABT6VY25_9ACTN|nr:LLM class flavin-dependent oxidoreductase [Streptantibioticus silvisoli]MDI5963390.1 LLM class flavin-dependent oxidoreductase [Streptantibioticus silvisoli]
MPSSPSPVRLAVALDGAGRHPAAWREPGARPRELLTAGYWAALVAEAENGLLDFVTIEDSLGLRPAGETGAAGRPDRVRGRLDAVLVASRVAPLTSHIGLVPTAVVTHTEPFHVSKAIATLDYVSGGRAGVRVKVSLDPADAALFGRRTVPPLGAGQAGTAAGPVLEEFFEEAADWIEVVRRLWDSWEDDAVIRDVATGRFVDRGKLHYVDFEGDHFRVRGPSITPRPPQGQPPVAALGHQAVPYRLIGRSTDIGFVTPHDDRRAAAIVTAVREEQAAAGRESQTVHVFGDLVVVLGDTEREAAERRERLDALDGAAFSPDAYVFAGTAAQLADLIQAWQGAGLTGFRLHPAVLPHDLERITRQLVPELQRRGAFRTAYEADTLRGLLGLPRPANRYAAA